ncbi:MAG: cytochrome c [Anderseniella sp.]|jgi:mono/diheme cytochrome c family protein|nr:cytochrome c [Anderseniella sp.]
MIKNSYVSQTAHALVTLVCLLFAVTPLANAGNTERGAQIYDVNCVACHGPNGKPDPDSPLVKSLGVMPAVFSDALFNSREPASTWKMVITHGGPAMGFSEAMPAFGGALSEQDIDSVLSYIKTMGGAHDYPDGSLNLFLPVRTKKAFPEDEWVWKQRYTGQDGDDAWKNTLEYEFRIGERAQGILELTHEVKGNEEDFGHLEPGVKYVLLHDQQAGFILTSAAQVAIPLNSDANWEFLPYLAMGKILSEKWTLQSSARLKFDMEDSDEGSAEFAGVVHYVHTDYGRAVFPGLELVAEVPFDRGDEPDRADAVQFSIVPQARIGLNKRGNIALNAGVEWPLNDNDRYDWQVYLYLIWDFADGGFFEGW